jgi:hypothetical protein
MVKIRQYLHYFVGVHQNFGGDLAIYSGEEAAAIAIVLSNNRLN